MKKLKILILIGAYLPGSKYGGPLRSIDNLVTYLGDEYDFFIYTSDRDLGDTNPYDNVCIDQWTDVGKAQVYYSSEGKFTFNKIKELSENVDLIFSCGFFESYAYKSMLLKRFGVINKKLIIAPMGVFSAGALRQKKLKKLIYIRMIRLFNIHKIVEWSITSSYEVSDIKRELGARVKIHIAEDLPGCLPNTLDKPVKKSGVAHIIFLSRISPKKNLIGAIQLLKSLQGNIMFDIYGPKEDFDYWQECEKELAKLPDNIVWHYKGSLASEEITDTFMKYDMFLFPTLGENFGHVIYESLAAGCIPVISDTTPWLDFEQYNCGYVTRLSDDEKFIEKLQYIVDMDNERYMEISTNAYDYADKKRKESISKTGYRKLFYI